jgi:hypothetical protein
MIEVGVAEQTAWLSGTNVLLRASVGIRKSMPMKPPSDDGEVSQEQLVIAHITGSVATLPSSDGSKLPYVDIEFVPVTDVRGQLQADGKALNLELSALPVALKRDINLDEFEVKVAVAKAQLGIVRPQSAHVALFAQVAADALGYAMMSHIKNAGLSTFQGMHVVSLDAAAGVAFTISDNFSIRAELGAKADLNWWDTRFQSDQKAYLEIRADLYKFMQIFLQASMVGNWDSGNNFYQGGPELMAGITFLW